MPIIFQIPMANNHKKSVNLEQQEREAIGVVEDGIIDFGRFVDFVANLFGYGRDVHNDAGKIAKTLRMGI